MRFDIAKSGTGIAYEIRNIVNIAEEERGELIASNAVQLAWAEENAQALELMQQRLEENRKISQLTPRQLAKRQKAIRLLLRCGL